MAFSPKETPFSSGESLNVRNPNHGKEILAFE